MRAVSLGVPLTASGLATSLTRQSSAKSGLSVDIETATSSGLAQLPLEAKT
ncbi:hypothetical protein KCP75_13760 [Salmonella enterica subsp. enterica]|nr:hypothetical protein KCP75_13760 [Salmonella enterica subsp. enterica]